jgi:hypothetical protein
MNHSITGFAYLINFFALLYFDYLLLRYWMKERTLLSKLWFFSILFFVLFMLIKAVAGLFFANNLFILKQTVYVGAFLQAFSLATMAYLVAYLSGKKNFSMISFVFALSLGIIGSVLTIFAPLNPSLDQRFSINWGLGSNTTALWVAFIRIFLFIIIFVPMMWINFRQFLISQDADAKRRSLGLGLSFILLAITAFMDFILITILKMEPFFRDITYIAAGVILLLTFLINQKQSDNNDKKDEQQV